MRGDWMEWHGGAKNLRKVEENMPSVGIEELSTIYIYLH